jgi:hypothetical protein
MFIVTWLFDKLGYMPKIDVQVGKVDLDLADTWPFPTVSKDFDPRPKTNPKPKKKPATKKVIVPKATTRKPKVVAKTARTKTK